MDTKETSTYHAVLIAAVVIGSIILYFIISVIRQQRKHRQLYKAKLQAEITTLEKERARVAADLHDELGPVLSAVKFKLAGIDNGSHDNDELVKVSMQYIDVILQQVRNIAYGLMPITLIRHGLIPAIEELIEHTGENSTLNIRFLQDDIPQFSSETSIHLYRIIQEIIHNTIKHADASNLKVHMYKKENKLYIATADDGKGFSTGITGNKSGFGLYNLKSRTEMLSGELHIKSHPHKGTSLFIEIPL